MSDSSEPKHLLKSKTVWLGVATVALGALQALQMLELPDAWVSVVGALVVVLRTVTTGPVKVSK